MVRFMISVANEPARRFKLLWELVGCGIAGIFVVVGAGYAFGGERAASSNTLHLIENIEPGGYHTHGMLMIVFGLLLSYSLSSYRRITRVALQCVLFYALLVAALIIGGWFFYKVDFGAPFWYLLVVFLATVLLVLAPPLTDQGLLYGYDRELGVGTDGNERA